MALSPALRIKKRTDGKAGSESSLSSSSYSDSSSAKFKGKGGISAGIGLSGGVGGSASAGVSVPKVDTKVGGGVSGGVGISGGAHLGLSGVSASGSANLGMFGGEQVLKEGSMKKQGGRRNRNKWSFRVFRLFPTCLRYYKDAKSAKPRGVLMLAEATVSTSDQKSFSFFVASPVKVVNIWPSSKEERDEWIVAIKNVVRKPFDGVDLNAQMKSQAETTKVQAQGGVNLKIGVGGNVSTGKKNDDSGSSSSSSGSDDGGNKAKD